MRRNLMLWSVQVLLALLFVFAGGMKLILPIEAMTGPVALPGAFLRFIGVAELLGGLGLVLPMAFRIRQELTPLAAAGLVAIMIGATVVTLLSGGSWSALFPAVVGLLSGWIAGNRASLVRGRVLAGTARPQVAG